MSVAKRASLVSIICLACETLACAQHSSFQFYGSDLGLTNQNVTALHQDRSGFLWVGTEGGLFRYDGDRFRSFPVETRRTKGTIAALYSSRDGQLWAGSSAGLFRWRSGQFVIEPGFENVELESAQALASDADSLYIAAPSGIRVLPLKGTAPVRTLSSKHAYSVLVSSDHTLWYGCDAALCSMAGGPTLEWGPERGVTSGPWQSIAEDASGRIWIRSMTKVLVKERGATAFHDMPELGGLDSTRGWQVIPIDSGSVLIPHNSGMVICSGSDCRKYGQESGLRRTKVLAAVVDREGSLWLGYSGHGLARWLGRNQWESFAEEEGLGDPGIWRIVRDRAGELWLGTTHGLYRGSQVGGRWRFKRAIEGADLTIYGLAAAPDGSLWFGAYQTKVNGLIRFDPKTHTTQLYRAPRDWSQFCVTALSRDETGTLWVATATGILRLRPGAIELEHYPTPLDGSAVFDVKSTRQGLFAAGKKGLYIEQGSVHHWLTAADGLRDSAAQSLVPRPDGSLWIDYFSPAGISRLDFEGNAPHIQHFSTRDGLPSDVIYAQFFDARGRHWVTTDNGASVLEDGRWIHYDTSNGLLWNDCNQGAFLAEADGSVWIGTSGGLARYRPISLPDAVFPATLITSVLRNDQPAQSMDFDAQTRSLSLRFTMLSYLTQNPRFRYRIGGSSSPWSQTTGHEVRLAELAAGTYDFVVQGEASPGVWSSPASLHFQIRAPWYLTYYAQAGLAFVIGSCLWLWWSARERNQLRIRAELERAVNERTRDLAEASARAERASRVKSDFVANISHEMRTPLNGVIGLTQLALEATGDPEVAEHLRIAQFSARSLLSLINDVLDFSKLEAGGMQIFPAIFELNPMLKDLRATFAHEAMRLGLQLEIVIADDMPQWVLADEGRLRQVLVNLVGNALKFTPAGSVTIRVGRCGDELRFSVADTGIGISADKQALIFDAFRQVDNSTSRRHGGTGLGLTISKRLVESMGGRLALQSTPGAGSTFTFTIQAPAATPETLQSALTNEPRTRPMHILVAEDNRVNQYLILALLKKLGHSAEVAGNGAEVLNMLSRSAYDLVLMDIQMPELDGLQATCQIRERESGTGDHLPIVALTARAMSGDRELFLSSGMDDYLEKPIQERLLREVLDHMSKLIQANSDAVDEP